ncbi:winged helix-turn-helix transcriptional regulator [Legionella waltersii]|uniref:MarR family transcriptional regulator n=1 Tax=Legionella waltersii TaxID=66969 RepID=A0A0W1ANN4_9GAMM|nr:helix-turn-helix domain-containing protein [Legionella waltersii]KTD82945.1 MarR family transcriptional regulator [Legionella waltersii]SNU97410.1 MarR family transcriptional regulator [Legionella waltersii]
MVHLIEMSEIKLLQRRAPLKTATMVETIYGCKWSLTVYALLRDGINRPGAMVRAVEGLTTKVLNECLRKNVEFGILEKRTFHEIPPRVEYVVTPFGKQFLKILDQLEMLNEQIQLT